MSADPSQPAIGQAQNTAATPSKLVSPGGLTSEEAQRRLKVYGPNALARERRHPGLELLGKLWAPVPWMLEAALILELALGKTVEGIVIAALLVFNVVLSFVQEGRAQHALALLRQRLAVRARVCRDGHWQLLPAESLVPGDLVHLRVGDLVPADVRLDDGQILVDQSALTGESLPVDASANAVVYAGTIVKRGEATGTVVAVGTKTTFGKTAELVRLTKATSQLETLILKIVTYLVGLDFALTAVVIAYALIVHLPLTDVIPFALVLLIASVPAALPATFTLATALGAVELAKRGVLVTRLSAIEEAASLDVLFTDKTGTITQNRLSVASIHAYAPETDSSVLGLATYACDEATQDPIDLAILEEARSRAITVGMGEREKFIPFDPSTKRSEALVRHGNQVLRVAKGAVREISAIAAADDASINADLTDLANRGYRVLAVAAGLTDAPRIVGLIGLHDPARSDSRALIDRLRNLGIRLFMVTGDSPATAHTVAADVGLGDRVCPPDLLGPDTNLKTVLSFDIFAGVFPEDKFHLVQIVQRAGHVVGMTGDGVNDSPALKQADVGIAVSNATDVAKAAASIVLTTPGLTDIVEAVTTSRRIYQRMLTYTLNMSVKKIEIPLFLAAGLIVFHSFVVTPLLMILLVFTNDFATMAITTDQVEPSATPNRWHVRPLIGAALGVACLLLMFNFGIYWSTTTLFALPISTVQTLVFVWLVLSSQATLYLVRERRHFWRSRPSRWLALSTVGDVIIAGILASAGWLMAPAPTAFLAALAALALVYLVLADQVKVWIFRLSEAHG